VVSTWVSASRITATFTIGVTATTDLRSVTVTAGGVTSAPQPFTVTTPVSAQPTLTSLALSANPRGAAGYAGRPYEGCNFLAASNVLSTTETLNDPTFSAAAWGTYGETNFVLSTGSVTYTDLPSGISTVCTRVRTASTWR
jgi:hypothetical protein